MTPAFAFNAAIPFTFNSSRAEAFAGLAVGACVAVALIRGLAQYQDSAIGDFWVDLCAPWSDPCSRRP